MLVSVTSYYTIHTSVTAEYQSFFHCFLIRSASCLYYCPSLESMMVQYTPKKWKFCHHAVPNTQDFFFFFQLNTKSEFMTVLVHFISSYFVFFLAELVVWIITAFSLLKKHYIWRLMFMGLIYKMLHRNCPTFDLTNISQVCVRVIQRTNKHIKKRRTPLFQICKSHVLEFVRS